MLVHQRRRCKGFLKTSVKERLHLDIAFNTCLRIFPFSICKLIREYRNNQDVCLDELFINATILLDLCVANPARSFTARADSNWILTWLYRFQLASNACSLTQIKENSPYDIFVVKQKFYHLISELLDDCYPPLKYRAFNRLRKHTFFGEV
jgi:hypothetical protein